VDVQEVIHANSDLFATPDKLPPSMTFDHSFPLQPGAVAINCRTYMYSPQQKDEIEK
jgi:hypothetical protein